MKAYAGFNFHTVSKYDYAIVRRSSGFAIRNSNQKLSLFWKERNATWTMIEVALSDCRDVSLITQNALLKSPINVGRGLLASSENVGNAIGTGISNAMAKRKARQKSGLKIRLKSLDRPEVFISIPEDDSRAQAFEAVSQFFETGQVSGQKIDFPYYMQAASANPAGDRSKTWIEGDFGATVWRWISHPVTLGLSSIGCGLIAQNVRTFIAAQGGFDNVFPEDRAIFYVSLCLAIAFGTFALVQLGRKAWQR